MSLQIASLNSGSNGNCFYLSNDKDAILVDAGLCCKETEARMARLGLSMKKLRAVFITHEHSDHIKGLAVLAKKYQLPVFISPGTLGASRLRLEDHLIRSFKAHESIMIGNLEITAFPKQHDASEPHSFIVSHQSTTVGVFTDIGFPCVEVIRYFKKCHAVFLEANYDEDLLERGNYPFYLKRRIRGGWGHLSNSQALQLFNLHRPKFMSHLFLSHLSKDNNSPEVVLELFRKGCPGIEVAIASRTGETDIFHIGDRKRLQKSSVNYPEQLCLFPEG